MRRGAHAAQVCGNNDRPSVGFTDDRRRGLHPRTNRSNASAPSAKKRMMSGRRAALFAQEGELFRRLDALSHDVQPQALAEHDHRADDEAELASRADRR